MAGNTGVPQAQDNGRPLKYEAGLRSKQSNDDVASPPTQAELVTAFGAAANNGDGFIALVDDNGADANMYVVVGNGTSYHYVACTKAV